MWVRWVFQPGWPDRVLWSRWRHLVGGRRRTGHSDTIGGGSVLPGTRPHLTGSSLAGVLIRRVGPMGGVHHRPSRRAREVADFHQWRYTASLEPRWSDALLPRQRKPDARRR